MGDGVAGFDYNKTDNNDSELRDSAALGSGLHNCACTRDNVTGVIWEVKAADGRLRDGANAFTWYQPDGPDRVFRAPRRAAVAWAAPAHSPLRSDGQRPWPLRRRRLAVA